MPIPPLPLIPPTAYRKLVVGLECYIGVGNPIYLWGCWFHPYVDREIAKTAYNLSVCFEGYVYPLDLKTRNTAYFWMRP